MRVICFGLDGADYDLVRELLPQGRLPTLARLSRQGTFGPLRSTTPAFTPTAWSSLLTGLNPAGHGIFAFTSNPNRGGGRLVSAASRAGAPLWRYLGAAGIKSAFVTVPFTHPPEPLKGILSTGCGGPRRACHAVVLVSVPVHPPPRAAEGHSRHRLRRTAAPRNCPAVCPQRHSRGLSGPARVASSVRPERLQGCNRDA